MRVALFVPEQDPDGLYDAWRHEFLDDPRFDVVSQHAIRKPHYAPGSAQCISLSVQPLTAIIESKSTGARWTVSAGNIRQLADRVKLMLRRPIAAE